MKKKIADRWVAELRSGKYKQATDHLRTETDGFCCLGVLCNMHAEAHPSIAAKQTKPTQYMGHSCVLPIEVIKWAGMSSATGSYNGGHLSRDNDCGANFNQIAITIEEQWKNI